MSSVSTESEDVSFSVGTSSKSEGKRRRVIIETDDESEGREDEEHGLGGVEPPLTHENSGDSSPPEKKKKKRRKRKHSIHRNEATVEKYDGPEITTESQSSALQSNELNSNLCQLRTEKEAHKSDKKRETRDVLENHRQPEDTPAVHEKSGSKKKSRGQTKLQKRIDKMNKFMDAATSYRRAESVLTRPTASAAGPQQASSSVQASEKVLDSHKALVQSLVSSITCQICLEPMSRPFTLALCGHTSCYDCLTLWFRAAPPEADLQPVPEYLASALDPQQQSLLLLNSRLLLNKTKTCPQCRGIVRDPPLEVWALKSIIDVLRGSGLVDDDSFNKMSTNGESASSLSKPNPWHGVFPSKEDLLFRLNEQTADANDMGLFDEEDDVRRCTVCLHEIWETFCTGCGRNYPGLETQNLANRDDYRGNLELQRAYIDLALDAEADEEQEEFGDGYESSFIDDEEHRSMRILSENSEEEQIFGGHMSDDPKSDSEMANDTLRRGSRHSEARRAIILSDLDEATDLSSPVTLGLPIRRSRALHTRQAILSEEDNEVNEVPVVQRISRRARHIFSSDEAEESDDLDNVVELHRRTRLISQASRKPYIVLSDDESIEECPNRIHVDSNDENEDNIGNLIAARERELYGEDDFVDADNEDEFDSSEENW